MRLRCCACWRAFLMRSDMRGDGYRVYKWLPHYKHVVGKYGVVNWNEGLHSMLRGKLNRLVRRTKSCAKSVETPMKLLALAFFDNIKLNAAQP